MLTRGLVCRSHRPSEKMLHPAWVLSNRSHSARGPCKNGYTDLLREGMVLLEAAVHMGYHMGWRRQTRSNSMVGPSILHGKEAKTPEQEQFSVLFRGVLMLWLLLLESTESYTQINRTRFVFLKDNYREDRFWISKLKSRDNCRFQKPPPSHIHWKP